MAKNSSDTQEQVIHALVTNCFGRQPDPTHYKRRMKFWATACRELASKLGCEDKEYLEMEPLYSSYCKGDDEGQVSLYYLFDAYKNYIDFNQKERLLDEIEIYLTNTDVYDKKGNIVDDVFRRAYEELLKLPINYKPHNIPIKS